jgi:hypothetical protein
MKDRANTTTASDRAGGAHTATCGGLPYGQFVTGHEARAHFATIVGTSTNATKSCPLGLSTSFSTSDHTTMSRHTDRSGKVLIRFPQHVRNLVVKGTTRQSVLQTKTARPDQVRSKCCTRIVAFISVAFSVLIVYCKQMVYILAESASSIYTSRPFSQQGCQPRLAGAIPYTLYINSSRPAPAGICNMIITPQSPESSQPCGRCGSAILSGSVAGGVCQFNDIEVANLQRQRRVVISLLLEFRTCSKLLCVKSVYYIVMLIFGSL